MAKWVRNQCMHSNKDEIITLDQNPLVMHCRCWQDNPEAENSI